MVKVKRIRILKADTEQIRYTEGEKPAVVSKCWELDLGKPVPVTALIQQLELLIERVEAWADAGDYLVGHIKLFIPVEEYGIWMASTGYGVNKNIDKEIAGIELAEADMNFTAILFGVSDDEVFCQIQKEVAKLEL